MITGCTRQLVRSAALTLLGLSCLAGCGKQAAVSVDAIDEPLARERALVIEHIQDPEARAELLTLIDEDEARMREFFDLRDRHKERVQVLNARYDASREEFEAELREFDEASFRVVSGMLERRARARALVTPDQWELITSGKAGYLDN